MINPSLLGTTLEHEAAKMTLGVTFSKRSTLNSPSKLSFNR